MLKIYVNDKEEKAEIEVHGNLDTLVTDTAFAIMKIYQEMLEGGREEQAREYRRMLGNILSKSFDTIDILHVRKMLEENHHSPDEIQELLDAIMKRRG